MGVSPLTGSTESRGPGVGQQEGQDPLGSCALAVSVGWGDSTIDDHVGINTQSRSTEPMAERDGIILRFLAYNASVVGYWVTVHRVTPCTPRPR